MAFAPGRLAPYASEFITHGQHNLVIGRGDASARAEVCILYVGREGMEFRLTVLIHVS